MQEKVRENRDFRELLRFRHKRVYLQILAVWNPYCSKGSRQDRFIRELSYDRISKVQKNRYFQIWDYGAEKLDLVRHSNS